MDTSKHEGREFKGTNIPVKKLNRLNEYELLELVELHKPNCNSKFYHDLVFNLCRFTKENVIDYIGGRKLNKQEMAELQLKYKQISLAKSIIRKVNKKANFNGVSDNAILQVADKITDIQRTGKTVYYSKSGNFKVRKTKFNNKNRNHKKW